MAKICLDDQIYIQNAASPTCLSTLNVPADSMFCWPFAYPAVCHANAATVALSDTHEADPYEL